VYIATWRGVRIFAPWIPVKSSYVIQSNQKVDVHLTKNPHKVVELKMAITKYIRNVERAILNTVFFQV